MHAPQIKPHPPNKTMHAPQIKPCMPPWSNHTPPQATMHAPHPEQPRMPPGSNHTWPPQQPCTHPPPGSNHACPPPWTEWQTGVKILPCPKLRLRAVIKPSSRSNRICWKWSPVQLYLVTEIEFGLLEGVCSGSRMPKEEVQSLRTFRKSFYEFVLNRMRPESRCQEKNKSCVDWNDRKLPSLFMFVCFGNESLFISLSLMREKIKKKVKITSGTRCDEVNTEGARGVTALCVCAETFSKKMEETIFCPSSFQNTSPLSSLVTDQAEWVSSVMFLGNFWSEGRPDEVLKSKMR